MTGLRDLVLDSNNFEGTLDEILDCGDCTETLRLFRSTMNPLTGTIPQLLSSFTMLQQLHIVGYDEIVGTIPTILGLLTNLEDLDLSSLPFADNSPLPSELGTLTKLEQLFFANSYVTGRVPEEFGSLTSLIELGIHRTDLTGTIPQSVCSIPSLQRIFHSESVECNCPGDICSLPP